MIDARFDQLSGPLSPSLNGSQDPFQDPYAGPGLSMPHAPAQASQQQAPHPSEPPPQTWQPYYPDELQRARSKYLRDWRIVKAARFNAAKRLERKQAASLLAFALAGTAGFVVPFFTLMFAEKLAPHTKNVLDFACYVSGALSLSIGLVEQARNHTAASQRFHKCGLAVNSVLRRLRNAPYPDEGTLNTLTAEYEQALIDCDHNHDDIDQAIAHTKDLLDGARHYAHANPRSLAESHVESLEKKLQLLKLQEMAHIYWLYGAVWLGPAVLGLIVWISLSSAG
jgi:hypothetical protein